MPQQVSLTPKTLETRRPVWEAFSDMYLDTDISQTRDWRIKLLAASPYSTDELEDILINEIHPVCKWNLACFAGEWAGFDPSWLEAEILKHLNSPFHHLLKPFRLALCTVSRWAEWRETKKAIEKLRNEHSAILHG